LEPTDNNPPPQADAVTAPSEADLRKLAALVDAHAPFDGRFELHVPGVSAVRFSQSSPRLVHAVVGPVLCVAAQGRRA
jgi:hypothetical protein